MLRRRILTSAGAVIAFFVGSGVASGQEVMQYFTAYGMPDSIFALLLAGIISMVIVYIIMDDSCKNHISDKESVLTYYCGKTLGTILSYELSVFLFMAYVVMIAGAGSVAVEGFNAPSYIARLIVTAVCCLTVLLGLEGIIEIIGKIGQLLVLVVVVFCIIALIKSPGDFTQMEELRESLNLTKAASNWFLSGINYACFSLIGAYPFLAGVGKSNQCKEAKYSGVLGMGGFYLAMFFINCVMFGKLSEDC